MVAFSFIILRAPQNYGFCSWSLTDSAVETLFQMVDPFQQRRSMWPMSLQWQLGPMGCLGDH